LYKFWFFSHYLLDLLCKVAAPVIPAKGSNPYLISFIPKLSLSPKGILTPLSSKVTASASLICFGSKTTYSNEWGKSLEFIVSEDPNLNNLYLSPQTLQEYGSFGDSSYEKKAADFPNLLD